MPLSDSAVKAAKPKESAYKLADSGGLYLFVSVKGAKSWRFDYKFDGVRGTITFGLYPDVSLARARDKHKEARARLADGLHPSGEIKQSARSFETVAREFIDKQSDVTVESTRTTKHWHLSLLSDALRATPVNEVKAPALLADLRKIEASGRADTAKRVRQLAGQTMRYAIAAGEADRDVASDLRGALRPIKQAHHAAIFDPEAVGALLRAIDGYSGTKTVQIALKLTPMLMVRPGELRAAEWSEINGDLWRIPASKMKMERDHLVPLPRQAMLLIEDLRAFKLDGPYLFSSERTPSRPMSENTINAALRRLGYTSDEVTAHGFRRTASTILNEKKWNSDWIERQLAHVETNKVRGAYNAAQWLDDRRVMMQWWADHLEELKTISGRPPEPS